VSSTFIDRGDHVVVLGRCGGTMKNGGAQWARLMT
jgi:hypothetical protein